jgi:hypothetical protein
MLSLQKKTGVGVLDNISVPPTLLNKTDDIGALDNISDPPTSSNKNDATPDGNNCLESDCFESSDLFSAQTTSSPKLLHGKKYLETLHEEKEVVEDNNYTSKVVDEEGDDDDDEDNFFSSQSFLEVVSGIADDLDEPQKPAANSPTSTTNKQCSMPPPHKSIIMELAAMSEEEAAEAIKNYQILWKRWTDMRLRERRQKNLSNAMKKCNFTGNLSPVLQLMSVSDVQLHRLNARDTFPDKETVCLRIAEEANLHGICIFTIRSDQRVMEVIGDSIYVKVNNTDGRGWVVTAAIV